MKSLCGEPVCLWLPEKYRKPNTSEYVQGVEVTTDYVGIIPDGFDVITLPAAKYLMFQGEPFKEEDYCQAIEALQLAMERYDPSTSDMRGTKRIPVFSWNLEAKEGISNRERFDNSADCREVKKIEIVRHTIENRLKNEIL